MDAARLTISSSGGGSVKQENSDGSVAHAQDCFDQEMRKEDELKSAKAKMSEVREENTRLKNVLKQIEKDYQSLQKHFLDTLQQEPKNNSNPPNTPHEEIEEPEPESEWVSLSLGRLKTPSDKKDDNTSTSCSKTREDDQNFRKGGLKLGLDYSNDSVVSKSDPVGVGLDPSPENSLEERKEVVDAGETWPPSKVLKTMRSEEESELSQQSSVKRARVSVRARCDTPTMNDGCQWRKYGQKISKGNPCPRAYYRCTVATACPVRKQVQRCAEDMSILITTYEGTHNHPLPISATSMASATSAAASMLLSGSSSTSQLPTNLHGLNFNPSDYSRTRPLYLPNTPSPAFPTITLDLTTGNSFPSSFPPSNFFPSSNFPLNPRFPSTSLNFSSSESSVWANGYLNYGSVPSYNKVHMGSTNLGRSFQEHLYQPQMEKNNNNNNQASSQQFLTETLTKAITSDPSFRSAIAAAVSSVVGGNGGAQGNQGVKGGLMHLQQPPLPFSLSKTTTTTSTADNRDHQIN